MKIITVNLPESYIKSIDTLIGEKMSYPSRSELVRVAVRDFLIRELEAVKSFQPLTATQNSNYKSDGHKIQSKPNDDDGTQLYIQVPLNAANLDEQTLYKTYRIVKK